MLIDPKYELLGGSIERNGKHSVQTRFLHLLGFPLIPRESYFVTKEGRERKVLEIRRDGRSIVACYLRGLPLAGALWVGMLAAVQFFIPEPMVPFEDDPLYFDKPLMFWIAAGGAVALLILALLAWIATRHGLSRDARARRAVYATWIGMPADPARLPDPWSLRDDLKRLIADSAEERGKMRHGFDRWQEILDDESLRDPEVLGAGLTLTRLLMGHPQKDTDPGNLTRLHEQLWMRLCAVQKP